MLISLTNLITKFFIIIIILKTIINNAIKMKKTKREIIENILVEIKPSLKKTLATSKSLLLEFMLSLLTYKVNNDH